MKISEIKELYDKKDKAHDWKHIILLRKNIKILKKPYKKIDEELLTFLTLFYGLKNYVTKNKEDFKKEYILSLLRHTKNPKKIEEKIVFDANMLNNIGKEGIKKALIFGKGINRDKPATFKYLKENIHKIKFHTKLGKKLGKKKIDLMKKILNQKLS